ncbi:MAG TPA: Hsp70 family protein [Sporichthyaceae bacterium]|nr:Hsp70 family protein [Sporichthyaceae bacterium]
MGGIDVDNALMASLLTQIPDATQWAEHERNLFRFNLERAKITLSTSGVAQVALPRGGLLEVSRAQFEAAIMPLIERTREPVELCLRERHGEIDHLLMVGGSSKMPVIRRFIKGIVGVEPSNAVDAMTAVGEGAAIAAAIMQGIITDLEFHVGTEHALGTVVHGDMCPPEGKFSVLIPRNMKYPAEASDKYTALVDYAEQLILWVIEGDPAKS